MTHQHVQQVAKNTMAYLEKTVVAGMTAQEVADLAEAFMKEAGIETFWYYGIGAFVHIGADTIVSESGRVYKPSQRQIQETDIVTVDLSPCIGNLWGDYARTIIVGNRTEFKEGLLTEKLLHGKLIEIARPEMTFHDLYEKMNGYIKYLGYENLDFGGNLGHSIEIQKDHRIYIERDNHARLSSKTFFTFEPHIRKINSLYGFKREDIYYFEGSRLRPL